MFYWVKVFLIPQQIMSSPHCPCYRSFETALHKATKNLMEYDNQKKNLSLRY